MKEIRPFYKKMLIVAIIIYVLGTCYTLSNLHHKVGQMEHTLWHVVQEHKHSR